jgi:hypothetical protein
MLHSFDPRSLLASLVLLSLGGCSGFVLFSNGQVLIAVTINPTLADPMNFPNLQVQFSASGLVNGSPKPVTPLGSVVWTIDRSAFSSPLPSPHASITQNGLARCTLGFTGSVQVFATAPANPSQPLSASNQMVGMAQLKCP